MTKFFSLWFALIIVLGVPEATAQTAERASMLFDRYRQSVVKIIVSGKRQDGTPQTQHGTGFVIAHNAPFLYVVTAGHVLGSGATRQADNKDWYVEDGEIKRTIQISGFDTYGFWKQLSGRVEQVPTTSPWDADLALLVVTDGPALAPIPLLRFDKSAALTRQVMLMGFRGESNLLTLPIPIGNGAQGGFNIYRTDTSSRPGESGGPWIDLKSGGVIAIASGQSKQLDAPSNRAIPADLVTSAFGALLSARGAKVNLVNDENAMSSSGALQKQPLLMGLRLPNFHRVEMKGSFGKEPKFILRNNEVAAYFSKTIEELPADVYYTFDETGEKTVRLDVDIKVQRNLHVIGSDGNIYMENANDIVKCEDGYSSIISNILSMGGRPVVLTKVTTSDNTEKMLKKTRP